MGTGKSSLPATTTSRLQILGALHAETFLHDTGPFIRRGQHGQKKNIKQLSFNHAKMS